MNTEDASLKPPGYWFGIIEYRMREKMRETFRDLDLSRGERRILQTLADGPKSVDEIEAALPPGERHRRMGARMFGSPGRGYGPGHWPGFGPGYWTGFGPGFGPGYWTGRGFGPRHWPGNSPAFGHGSGRWYGRGFAPGQNGDAAPSTNVDPEVSAGDESGPASGSSGGRPDAHAEHGAHEWHARHDWHHGEHEHADFRDYGHTGFGPVPEAHRGPDAAHAHHGPDAVHEHDAAQGPDDAHVHDAAQGPDDAHGPDDAQVHDAVHGHNKAHGHNADHGHHAHHGPHAGHGDCSEHGDRHERRRPRSVAEVLVDFAERGWVVLDDAGATLTDAGRTAHDEAQSRVMQLRASVTEGISEDDYRTTIATLEKMARNVGWGDDDETDSDEGADADEDNTEAPRAEPEA